MFLAEEGGQFEYPVFETGFSASEVQELMSLFQVGDNIDDHVRENSGSHGSNRTFDSVEDEKKRRRKLSNRESARRSRWRKKKHLENLSNQLNRLKVENRELKNRLGPVLNQCGVIRRENERLMSESVALLTRLSDIYRILVPLSNNHVQLDEQII